MKSNIEKKKYQRPEIKSIALKTENIMYSTSVPVGDGPAPGTADARSFNDYWDEEEELLNLQNK